MRSKAPDLTGDTVFGWRVLELLPSGDYALACSGCEAKATKTPHALGKLLAREWEHDGPKGCAACQRAARSAS